MVSSGREGCPEGQAADLQSRRGHQAGSGHRESGWKERTRAGLGAWEKATAAAASGHARESVCTQV